MFGVFKGKEGLGESLALKEGKQNDFLASDLMRIQGFLAGF